MLVVLLDLHIASLERMMDTNKLKPTVIIQIYKETNDSFTKIKSFRNVSLRKKTTKDGKVFLTINRDNKEKEALLMSRNATRISSKFLHEGKVGINFGDHQCFIALKEVNPPNVRHFQDFINHLAGRQITKKVYVKESRLSVEHIGQLSRLPNCKGIDWNNLTSLDLSNRNLTTLPVVLGELSLSVLNLGHNELTDNPHDWKWIKGPIIKSLRYINLESNKLCNLPIRLQRCWNLLQIDAQNNALTTIPAAFLDPVRPFEAMNLELNPLQILPEFFKKLKCLQVSRVSGWNFNKIKAIRPSNNPESLFSLAAEQVLWQMNFGNEQFLNWLYSTPGLLPETVLDRLDSYEMCYYCRKRIFNAFHISYMTCLSLLAIICRYEEHEPVPVLRSLCTKHSYKI